MNQSTIAVDIVLLVSLLAVVILYLVVRGLLKKYHNTNRRMNDDLHRELHTKVPGIDEGNVLTCRFNRKTLVLIFNEEKAKQAGLPTHFWTYDSFIKTLHSDCLNVFEMWIFHYAKQHRPVKRRLRFHLTFDEGKTWHWWEMIYEMDETNLDADWFYGLFVNIDKVKEMENSIEDCQKKIYDVEMKEALLAAINHDIRTPLNAVAGFATLLAGQYDEFSEEERKEFSEIVCSNSEIMLALVDSLKSMSNDEIAEKSYAVMPKSVSKLVSFCYNTNHIICPSHLTFKESMPEDVEDKIINIDPMRVERVINNFLSNAFKFTAVGEVTLGWRYLEETKQVEIYVSDTGIGISPENQEKVFEEFAKLNEHAHGTGLGLNICKKIVEKLDGEIGLTSQLGKGSVFYCRFNTIENEQNDEL